MLLSELIVSVCMCRAVKAAFTGDENEREREELGACNAYEVSKIW